MVSEWFRQIFNHAVSFCRADHKELVITSSSLREFYEKYDPPLNDKDKVQNRMHGEQQ